MDAISFSILAVLLGARHGMDADHLAAISDMVGGENKKNRQVKLGLMYALGHGLIVLVMGLIVIFLGLQLSDQFQVIAESLVGVTLILLGGGTLYSIFKQRSQYYYKSRLTMIYEIFLKLVKKNTSRDAFSPLKFGAFGAMIIGIIHGIGVETPTQITVIAGAAGLHHLTSSVIQLLLFVIGLLISTGCFTFLASWGFVKAKNRQKLFIALGSLTGIYSLWLGFTIIQGI